MNPSWDLSYGTVCICVLHWLSWTDSLHGHCVHLRPAVTCEGSVLVGVVLVLVLLLLLLLLVVVVVVLVVVVVVVFVLSTYRQIRS